MAFKPQRTRIWMDGFLNRKVNADAFRTHYALPRDCRHCGSPLLRVRRDSTKALRCSGSLAAGQSCDEANPFLAIPDLFPEETP